MFKTTNIAGPSQMATIERLAVPGGGLVKLAVQPLEHCPPHATCRDGAGGWTARIEFSYSDNIVMLMDVIPPQNAPPTRVINDLIRAISINLAAYRQKWWEFQCSNPAIAATGACCLNNKTIQGRYVSTAIYDPAAHKTIIALSDGSIYNWPP